MSIKSRLLRLKRHPWPRRDDEGDWRTEEQWLAEFAKMGRDGVFRDQPGFPDALEALRVALEDAGASLDPPADFMPNLMDLPHLRLLNWRTRFRFPEVHQAMDRLGKLLDRVVNEEKRCAGKTV